MANKNGVTPNKLFGVPARMAGGGEGSKMGPKVNDPTYPPCSPGNPASLSATNMQGDSNGADAGRYRDC